MLGSATPLATGAQRPAHAVGQKCGPPRGEAGLEPPAHAPRASVQRRARTAPPAALGGSRSAPPPRRTPIAPAGAGGGESREAAPLRIFGGNAAPPPIPHGGPAATRTEGGVARATVRAPPLGEACCSQRREGERRLPNQKRRWPEHAGASPPPPVHHQPPPRSMRGPRIAWPPHSAGNRLGRRGGRESARARSRRPDASATDRPQGAHVIAGGPHGGRHPGAREPWPA
eukprot:scaffold23116_cov103-Isochrysis_galbana.AAC.5